ncbi:MAG: hypothetical protein QG593_658 [Patescibacteria group bacterium]|nr:hypothetical protein [Patescibacteria group bacterium]
MKLQDLTEVTSIDQEIITLHSRLTKLYDQRNALFSLRNVDTGLDEEAMDYYKKILKSWAVYGIQIPKFTEISKQISKALKVREEWVQNNPDYSDSLEILLVPPNKLIGPANLNDLRLKQRLVHNVDIFDEDVDVPAGSAKWRILVAYSKSAGVDIVQSSMMTSTSSASALGMQEYIALTLQLSQPIDLNTWTSFAGKKSSGQIIFAGFRQGRYRFAVNDIHGVMDDDKFRPAVEVR